MPSARKLKVGLVFDDTLDSADGVAQYVKTLGRWLSENGHEVCYLVGETTAQEWAGGRIYSLARNHKVRFNGNKLSIPGPANRRRIRQILAEEKFDVLHVQTPYSPLLAARVINLSSKDTVIVGTFHIFPAGWASRTGTRCLRFVLRRSLGRFARMLAVSQASADFAKSAFKLNAEIVPNAVDTAAMSKAPAKQRRGIVFVGRLVERKGCLYLLKAFRQLAVELPDARLTIVGKGAQDAKLKDFVRRFDLSQRVHFAGFVSEDEKARLLSEAAVACFPSLYGEAFGIVLIEAMAAGSGVVLGGDNPGYRSVLGDQEALLINPRDSAAFAQRLKLLLSDQNLAAKLHEWQTETVRQYDVNVVGNRIVDIYRSLIANVHKNEHNEG